MTTYRPGAGNGRVAGIKDSDRMNNQVIINDEANPTLKVPKGIFCLELVKATSAETIVIKDGNGVTVLTAINSLNQEHSPVRLNGGIDITGNVEHIKGFVIGGMST